MAREWTKLNKMNPSVRNMGEGKNWTGTDERHKPAVRETLRFSWRCTKTHIRKAGVCQDYGQPTSVRVGNNWQSKVLPIPPLRPPFHTQREYSKEPWEPGRQGAPCHRNRLSKNTHQKKKFHISRLDNQVSQGTKESRGDKGLSPLRAIENHSACYRQSPQTRESLHRWHQTGVNYTLGRDLIARLTR